MFETRQMLGVLEHLDFKVDAYWWFKREPIFCEHVLLLIIHHDITFMHLNNVFIQNNLQMII